MNRTPTMAVTGEIRFDDGTVMLVPQPMKFAEVSLADAYVYNTLPELPSHEEVMQAASSNAPARKESVWGLVVGLAGGALMLASGLGFIVLGGWMRFAS